MSPVEVEGCWKDNFGGFIQAQLEVPCPLGLVCMLGLEC